MTTARFKVVHDQFCDDCRQSNAVYQCSMTFCNGCTDMTAWLTSTNKTCPKCGYAGPGTVSDAVVEQPEFQEHAVIQIMVEADAETLEQIRATFEVNATLCDYSEENGMVDLDQDVETAVNQLAQHLGIDCEISPEFVKTLDIRVRNALSNAVCESPHWEDHRKVSKRFLQIIAYRFGDQLVPAVIEEAKKRA